MEKSTVIGLVGGVISVFVGMILKGAPLSALNNPAAFLIIIGGTVACIFNAFPMEKVMKVPTLFKILMRGNENQSRGELVKTFRNLLAAKVSWRWKVALKVLRIRSLKTV